VTIARETEPQLLQGNEAVAEAAIAAGARFFAGYPITPSTEIAELLARRLPEVGGTFVQMEDEIASMAAVVGASLCGVKSLTATSGPGFSLMQENIGFAVMSEVPCVIVNVQRQGPSTGNPTQPGQGDVMQARWGTHGTHPMITLASASVRECFDLTVTAFNFAERYRTPVILLSDAVVGHMREVVRLPAPGALALEERRRPNVPPSEWIPYATDRETGVPAMADFGTGYRSHVTGLIHDEMGFPSGDPEVASSLIQRLLAKVWYHRDDVTMVEMEYMDDARLAVVAFGSVARSARAAVRIARENGVRAGLVRLSTLWPFPYDVLRDVAGWVNHIIVAEMNLGQVVNEVERACHGLAEVEAVQRADGTLLGPQQIWAKMKELL
jgi:2-oxoglutarate ferredoxin oxidoreductase subunit alpha